MSQFIHHVRGRLPVRSRSLRCKPHQMEALGRRLLTMHGVEPVNLRQKAGSLTVHYDPAVLDQCELLAEFERAGCIETTKQHEKANHPVGEVAQRALVGTLVQLTVERSVRSLVSALI